MPKPLHIDPELSQFSTGTTSEDVSDVLRLKCKNRIHNIRDDISSIDNRILLLRREIDKLNSERKALLKEQDRFIHVVAPARDLPNELIAKIISFSFRNPGMLNQEDRLQFRTLRWVCKKWRDVAFSTPTLWRGLEVILQAKSGSWTSPSQLDSWFRRGGDEAQIRLGIVLGWAEMEMTKSLADVFDFMSSRNLAELAITGASCKVLTSLLDRWETTPSTLRGLQLNIEEVQLESLIRRFSTATLPSLTNLHISGLTMHPFQHSSIVYLYIGARCLTDNVIDPVMFAAILSPEGLPHMEELVLGPALESMVEREVGEEVAAAYTSHPRVKKLVVIGRRTVAALQLMAFPALQFMRVDHLLSPDNSPEEWIVPTHRLEAFLTRMASQPNFHTLSLENANVDGQTIGALVSDLQEVRQINVRDYEFFDYIVTKKLTASMGLGKLEAVLCTDTWYYPEADSKGQLVRHVEGITDFLTLRAKFACTSRASLRIYESTETDKGRRAVLLPVEKDSEHDKAITQLRLLGAEVVFGDEVSVMANYAINAHGYQYHSASKRWQAKKEIDAFTSLIENRPLTWVP
ncbi:hypothetical protein FA15DRAFT_675523 [Coprinopsis marcescibilis]|uniref:F-box domain-containing protein n=1 Tax=Coprinopsis marcescibilis TaxID=230819 RepID=A0A5C3KDU9_COPMA|nr:hypothetical protein FA15DRAFT_675523 [Coprinopsis marcescibilis]